MSQKDLIPENPNPGPTPGLTTEKISNSRVIIKGTVTMLLTLVGLGVVGYLLLLMLK